MIGRDRSFRALLFALSMLVAFAFPARAATSDLVTILVNGIPVTELEESDWIEESSTITVIDSLHVTKITVSVAMDSSIVRIDPADEFQARVTFEDKDVSSLNLQLPNRIKKYKIGIKASEDPDDPEAYHLFIRSRVGDEITWTKTDLLIVTGIVKGIRKAFDWLKPSEMTIKIFSDSNSEEHSNG